MLNELANDTGLEQVLKYYDSTGNYKDSEQHVWHLNIDVSAQIEDMVSQKNLFMERKCKNSVCR